MFEVSSSMLRLSLSCEQSHLDKQATLSKREARFIQYSINRTRTRDNVS